MEKKEKSESQKLDIKIGQMNRNMFSFIKQIDRVNVQMPVLNQPDPNDPTGFIPQNEIVGTSVTNQEFKFKLIIDKSTPDLNRFLIINDQIKFQVSTNSDLKFVLTNYQVPEITNQETIITEPETKQNKK